MNRGRANWVGAARAQRLDLDLHSLLPLFTSERQDQILRFAGATSLAQAHDGTRVPAVSSAAFVLASTTGKPAIRQLAVCCFEALSNLERHLDIPTAKRSKSVFGGPHSMGLKGELLGPDALVSTAEGGNVNFQFDAAKLVNIGQGSQAAAAVGVALSARQLLDACSNVSDATTLSYFRGADITAAVHRVDTHLSAYEDKDLLAMGFPPFLENAFLQHVGSSQQTAHSTRPSTLPRSRAGTDWTEGELRRRFKQHVIFLQVVLGNVAGGSGKPPNPNFHGPSNETAASTRSWDRLQQRKLDLVASNSESSGSERDDLVRLFMRQLGGGFDGSGLGTSVTLNGGLGTAHDSELASATVLVDIYESNLARVYQGLAQNLAAAEGHGDTEGPPMVGGRSSVAPSSIPSSTMQQDIAFASRARFAGPHARYGGGPNGGGYSAMAAPHHAFHVSPGVRSGFESGAGGGNRPSTLMSWNTLSTNHQVGPFGQGRPNGGGWAGLGSIGGFTMGAGSFGPPGHGGLGLGALGGAGSGDVGSAAGMGPGGLGVSAIGDGGPGGLGSARTSGLSAGAANQSLMMKAHSELALDEHFSAAELLAAIERINFQARAASGKAIICKLEWGRAVDELACGSDDLCSNHHWYRL